MLLCAASAVLAARTPAPDQKPLVAVLEPTGGAGVTDMSRNTVRDTLQRHIFNSRKYRVADRGRTDKAANGGAFAGGGAVDGGKLKTLGRLLEADYVCVSDLRREGGHFVVACSLIDVRSGEVFAQATELVAPGVPTDFKAGAEKVARTLLAGGGRPEPKPESKPEPEPKPEPKLEPRPEPRHEPARHHAQPAVSDSSEVREAKATLNRLMPYFSFSRDRHGVSCTSSLLSQYEENQRKYFADQKNWSASWDGYQWHSLFAEIKSGRLEAFSRYTYANPTNGRTTHALAHNALAVTANGRVTTAVLAPVPATGSSSSKEGAGGAFSGGESVAPGAVQREEGAIVSEDVPRAIAAARGGRVKVELKGNRGLQFDLNESVKEGIAQTVELYDAIRVLEAAGVEIQKRY
jgi:hypothetical protein